MSTTHYSETQYFRQDWLWALLLVGSVPAGVLAVVAILADSAPGEDVTVPLAIVSLLVFGPLVVLYRANLDIRVQDDGLRLKLWPFHLRARTVACADIERVRVTDISPMGDFGGVGIRLQPRLYRWGITFDGPVGYIVSGDRGVRIERRDGPDVVLTSSDPQTLATALERVCR